MKFSTATIIACAGAQQALAFGGANNGASKALDTTSVEWKIQAYASAGPSDLTKDATIMDADMSVLREGTNDWSCMPGNPRGEPEGGFKDAHEAMPLCFDSVGMQWMQGWMANETPVMDRDTIVYMFHGDMGECNSKPGVLNKEDCETGDWIESGSHVMFMPKDATMFDAAPESATDFTQGIPYIMFKGTPYAHVMMPLEGYYDYTPSVSVTPLVEPDADHTSDEWKIWAFSQAAPAKLVESATILGADMSVIKEGTNTWSCAPGNPDGEPDGGFANPHEAMPVCFCPVGAAWMQAWMSETTPEMTGPASMYMLQGDTGECNSIPRVGSNKEACTTGDWIESGPHLMIVPKVGSDLDAFPSDPFVGEPYTMFPGDKYAHLMIPLEGYYQY